MPKTRPSKSGDRRLEKRNRSPVGAAALNPLEHRARGATWWLAARLRTRMPTGCSVCCRRGITRGFARIFNVFRWSTGSLSTALTGPSDLSISSRPASAPWSTPWRTARRPRSARSATRASWVCTWCWATTGAPTGVYVQVPGAGSRMKATLFKKELARSASMRAVMLRYVHAFFNQVAQSAACNQFHSLQQRCCRWLLITHRPHAVG